MLHEVEKGMELKFMTAGKALVTIESGKTGTRYTYKVNKPKGKNVWFVKLLVGTNNESNYEYIGYFTTDYKVKTSDKSRMNDDSTPIVAIRYTLEKAKANNIPEGLHIYHSCKCGRCGRTLTTPESIKSGIGPECIKY